MTAKEPEGPYRFTCPVGWRLVGIRLETLREGRGLSLREAAESMGLTPSRLQQLERGQVPLSGTDFAAAQEFYSAEPWYLLGRPNLCRKN